MSESNLSTEYIKKFSLPQMPQAPSSGNFGDTQSQTSGIPQVPNILSQIRKVNTTIETPTQQTPQQTSTGEAAMAFSDATKASLSAADDRAKVMRGGGTTTSQSQQPQDQASMIAAAIKQIESGGKYDIKGGSGEYGAYQFMPNTWKEWAGKYLNNSAADMSPQNQDKVARSRVAELMSQGYSLEDIALIWNGGEPVRKSGVNSFGVKYDSGAYADKVLGAFNEIMQQSNTPDQKYANLKGMKFEDLGVRTTPYGGSTRVENVHPGIDIANKIGTPIPAFTGGVVSQVVDGKKQDMKGGYGNYVIVTDPNGNQHRYSHLSGDFVQVGQKVTQGQKIGEMGNTGAAYSTSGGTGSHLDYRIKSAAGKYLNPNSYIDKYFQS